METTELQALIVRAASACSVWSEAEEAYEKSGLRDADFYSVCEQATFAKTEAIKAGAALAKAFRAVKAAP